MGPFHRKFPRLARPISLPALQAAPVLRSVSVSTLIEGERCCHRACALARKQGEPMIVFIQREPRPDAPSWPGRRLLAVADAVAWPLAWLLLVQMIPGAGRATLLAVIVAALFALSRVYGAIFKNHRYRFTSFWVGRLVVLLLVVGVVAKAAVWLVPAVQ